jgi:hypothetical protein
MIRGAGGRRIVFEDGVMTILFITPLTILPLIVFNLVAWAFGTPPSDVWTGTVFSLTMISGQPWKLEIGDLMVVFAIVCLFFEVLKSTSSSSRTIINHVLSTIVFIIYLIEFLAVPFAAHSVFFILLVIAVFDVVAGFTITIKTASRDIALGRTLDTGT